MTRIKTTNCEHGPNEQNFNFACGFDMKRMKSRGLGFFYILTGDG
ncbi:hypothetical protein IMCC14465_14550 [alpha proteobacterium IMCC14465]|uniref:Uncharacterized protein n=1 Tax=alpha proteobacterium IMCC14465 TaxID=1220535 RepID=J9E170_9PROT|nr:hypothetical protein IMCC14465_14550 [alpha proteobacterium IMCC14465]